MCNMETPITTIEIIFVKVQHGAPQLLVLKTTQLLLLLITTNFCNGCMEQNHSKPPTNF